MAQIVTKSAILGVMLSLAGVSFGTVTNVWNNATGDGKWSSAGNWSEGHAPLPSEYVFVSNDVPRAVIDIGAEPVTVKALIVGAPSAAVTNTLWFVGKGLTLTEQFTGDSRNNPGNIEIPNRLVPLQVRSRSTVVFDVPVTFGDGSYNSGLWHGALYGQTLTFLKVVTVPGAKDFRIHNYQSSFVNFKGAFEHAGGDLRENSYPSGKARFYGPVRVKSITKKVDWNNPTWVFMGKDSSFEIIHLTHSAKFSQGTPGFFNTNHVLNVYGHPSIDSTWCNSGCYYNLGDQPRTVIDRLSTDAGEAAVWSNLMSGGTKWGAAVTSTANLEGLSSDGSGHARLTLRGTSDDLSGLAIYGAYGSNSPDLLHTPIDVVWDPIGDFTQTLTGRVHYTWGTLTVKRGTLRVAGSASFAYVPRISVLAGDSDTTFDLDVTKANSLALVRWIDLQGAKARFRIGPGATTPFGTDRAIALVDSGAKFVMPAGASASLMAVVYNGQKLADDTYTGGETTASAKHADWIDGDGTITIIGSAKLAHWTAGASGAYETAANWAGNAAPDASTTAVLFDKATAAPLTITVSSAIAAFPTDLFVRNRGTSVTTLSIEADVAHEKGNVRVETGGKVVVKNATYTYTGTYAEEKKTPADSLANRRSIRVTEGGEWVTDAGGQTLIEYFVGSFLVDGSTSLTGRVAAVNGGYMKYLGWSNYPLHVHPGGLLEMKDGGRVHLPHYSWNHLTTLDLHGGRLNVKDGIYGGTNICGGSIRFGQGEVSFSGTSTNWFGGGVQTLCPVASGEKLHFTMEDDCYSWDTDNNFYLTLGATEGTETVVDYKTKTLGRNIAPKIGINGGRAMLNLMGSATLSCNSYGLIVGHRKGLNTTKVEGYLNVPTGTTVGAGGSTSSWAASGGDNVNMGSLVVGLGTGADSEPPYSRNAYGEVRVTGGTVQQSDGHALIGVGSGEGLYMHESGTTKFTIAACQTVVGLAGGLGHLIVSNGTVTTRTFFIGGCPKDRFAYAANWEANPGVPFSRHDAMGTVTVAGGSLTTGDYPMILGADGSGTVEMVGSTGALTANSLILSNATQSVARFVPDAAGVSPITVTTRLTIADGAKLELDLRQYEGTRTRFKLFSFASSEGAFAPENISVIGKDGQPATDFHVRQTDTDLTLAQNRGGVLIVR